MRRPGTKSDRLSHWRYLIENSCSCFVSVPCSKHDGSRRVAGGSLLCIRPRAEKKEHPMAGLANLVRDKGVTFSSERCVRNPSESFFQVVIRGARRVSADFQGSERFTNWTDPISVI